MNQPIQWKIKSFCSKNSSEDALGSAERALEPAMIWELKSAKELHHPLFGGVVVVVCEVFFSELYVSI